MSTGAPIRSSGLDVLITAGEMRRFNYLVCSFPPNLVHCLAIVKI